MRRLACTRRGDEHSRSPGNKRREEFGNDSVDGEAGYHTRR